MRQLLLVACVVAMLGCANRRNGSAADAPVSEGQKQVSERQKQIERLQEFTAEKGFPRTGNFERGRRGAEAYFLCYSAGKWELPDSYDDLGYRERKTADCGLDESRFDIYLHRAEAVAFEDTPVTESLEKASDERALMVVAHEEAHEDPQLDRLPHPVAEAASTLLGMLTAANFAMKDGDVEAATRLSADARLYQKKALLVNELHSTLKALYEDRRRGKRPPAEVAEAKARLFAEATAACESLGRAHSINLCLPVANNAGLAFDHSYTREYPALFSLYLATGEDYDRFVAELRALGLERARNLPAMRARIARRTSELRAAGQPAR